MAGVAAPAGDRNAPPVGVQVARGIGWTALGLAALLVGLVLVTKPGRSNGFGPQWEAIAIVASVVVATTFVVRRLRRWSARPRWLVPLAIAVPVLAALPAFAPFESDGYGFRDITCTALVDAWHPTVATPAPEDIDVWQDLYRSSPPALPTDPEQRRAALLDYRDHVLAVRVTPAYQRADRYFFWATSQDSCAPRSRDRLMLSAGLLAGGALLLTGATVAAARRSSRTRSQ